MFSKFISTLFAPSRSSPAKDTTSRAHPVDEAQKNTLNPAEYISWADIDRASAAWRIAGGAMNTPFDEFRGKFLPLPEWFDSSLAPLSPEYLAQQDRLWQMMIGEDVSYAPERDELTGADDAIALTRPGLYSGAIESAGDHLIALGHIIQKCGLKRGDRVLEYGAGYGQIALALARLGMTVHTVDIDPGFCSAVQKQADWFKVSLTAHQGKFGDNPSGQQYAVILFYEAFHHARDFPILIERCKNMLLPGGKIMMAGEPIQPRTEEIFAKACPYPWGIRLEAEVAAIVRFRRWYELGFQEEFLFDIFDEMGFTPKKHPNQISPYATIYTFTLRSKKIMLAEWEASPDIMRSWHGPQPEGGRFTTVRSSFPVERLPNWSRVRVACTNYHNAILMVNFQMGTVSERIAFAPSETKDVLLPRCAGEKFLHIECQPIQPPRTLGIPDDRYLGVFVREVEFLNDPRAISKIPAKASSAEITQSVTQRAIDGKALTAQAAQMKNPYSTLPDSSFWRRSVANIDIALVDPVTSVPFKISRQNKVATAGSCFAQHISRTLVQQGFNYITTEVAPSDEDIQTYQAVSAGYGNIYTTRQLLQLFDRAYGVKRPVDEVWCKEGNVLVDPFRPNIRRAGFTAIEDLQTARRHHLACVRRVFDSCDIFVFTLGLTEGWVSEIDGTVVPLAPGVSGVSVQGYAYRFENFSLDDVVKDLTLFINQLREVNPNSRVILTVSPVPLIATYENRHILLSNTLSKATLRLAADMVSNALPEVAYFPSYEIITGAHARGQYFAEDLRSVTNEGVAHVMHIFGKHFLSDDAATPVKQLKRKIVAITNQDAKRFAEIEAVICDEEWIDK
jgi:SAM-dependent methyltransferase